MNAELQALIGLQEVDDRIGALRREIAAIPGRIEKEKAYLVSFEEAGERNRAELEETNKSQRAAEGEIQAADEKLRETRGKQALIKSNEEYKALSSEILSFEKRISDLEDQVLECMERIPPLKREIAEGEGDLKEAQQKVAAATKRHEEDLARFKEDLARRLEEREEMVARISRPWLSRYDMLHQGRDGLAVCPIVDQACHGCRLSETLQRFIEIRNSKDEIFTCTGCARILYFQEAEKVSAVSAADEPE